jgi:VIT1/CCC1 family predicted Fe2+/Mn2+ transporter
MRSATLECHRKVDRNWMFFPMPQAPHIERHFTSGNLVRDIVIGMSDGLTVPFALAAGISGAVASTGIVVTAGLAEVAAGAIAMGLGGYLASHSDTEHYNSERAREEREVIDMKEAERQEVLDVFRAYGVTDEQAKPVVDALESNPKAWVDFMMQFELGLEKPEPTRARNSALTIAMSYIVGGLVPLSPYMLLHNGHAALETSIGVTLLALLIFGYVKGRFTGKTPFRSAFQTATVGGVAAAAAFAIAKLIA